MSMRPTWMWEVTIPRKESVESSLEQRPRVTQDAYMDIGGRAMQEQLPSSYRDGRAGICIDTQEQSFSNTH